MLVLVWMLAAVGVAIRMVWLDAPRVAVGSVYLAVGWFALVHLPAFAPGVQRRRDRLARGRRPAVHGRCRGVRAASPEPLAVHVRLPRDLSRLRRRRSVLSLDERVPDGRLTAAVQLARTARSAPGWRPARTSNASDVA